MEEHRPEQRSQTPNLRSSNSNKTCSSLLFPLWFARVSEWELWWGWCAGSQLEVPWAVSSTLEKCLGQSEPRVPAHGRGKKPNGSWGENLDKSPIAHRVFESCLPFFTECLCLLLQNCSFRVRTRCTFSHITNCCHQATKSYPTLSNFSFFYITKFFGWLESFIEKEAAKFSCFLYLVYIQT